MEATTFMDNSAALTAITQFGNQAKFLEKRIQATLNRAKADTELLATPILLRL